MKTFAKQKNIHLSPRKAGLVCDLIKGKSIEAARVILANTDKKASGIIAKLLNSAVANATNNFSMDPNALYVYNAIADQGTTIKRTLPRAKGSGNLLRKRHVHLTIWVSDDRNQNKIDLAKPTKNADTKSTSKKIKVGKEVK